MAGLLAKGLVLLSGLLFAISSWAVIETYQFDNELQEARYHAFIEELRCPKCQNQNLSGSDSEISQDLRRQIHQMIMAGQSDIEITQYMLDRYGDFILYRPRFTATTAALWLSPLILLLLGLVVWLRLSRRRPGQTETSAALSDEEQARLKAMLDRAGDANHD